MTEKFQSRVIDDLSPTPNPACYTLSMNGEDGISFIFMKVMEKLPLEMKEFSH